jgi:hypothetical protein
MRNAFFLAGIEKVVYRPLPMGGVAAPVTLFLGAA